MMPPKVASALIGAVASSFLMFGCDESKPAPAATPSGGDGAFGKLPDDIPEPLADDRAATLLLNDAFAAVDRREFKVAEEKIAEIEKLKAISPGIHQQVAEVRAGIVAATSRPAE